MFSSYLLGGLSGLAWPTLGFTLPGFKNFTGSSDALASLILALAIIMLVWPHFYRRTKARNKARKLSPVFYPEKRLDMSGHFIC